MARACRRSTLTRRITRQSIFRSSRAGLSQTDITRDFSFATVDRVMAARDIGARPVMNHFNPAGRYRREAQRLWPAEVPQRGRARYRGARVLSRERPAAVGGKLEGLSAPALFDVSWGIDVNGFGVVRLRPRHSHPMRHPHPARRFLPASAPQLRTGRAG